MMIEASLLPLALFILLVLTKTLPRKPSSLFYGHDMRSPRNMLPPPSNHRNHTMETNTQHLPLEKGKTTNSTTRADLTSEGTLPPQHHGAQTAARTTLIR
jgi:hypothetical protein